MDVDLYDSVSAEVIQGVQLKQKPRWGLRDLSLMVGPYGSGEAHEQHFLASIGSGNWYRPEFDEMLFGRESFVLESIWFHIPGENYASDEFIASWKKEQPIQGLPRLKTSQSFQLEPTEFRLMDSGCMFLSCITRKALEAHNVRLRLRIAKDFDLLFSDGRLCGWLLFDPAHYLVRGWEEPYATEPNDKDRGLLYEYQNLVVQPNIEKMEDEDSSMLQKLKELQSRIKSDSDITNQRAVLKESVDDIIDSFYG